MVGDSQYCWVFEQSWCLLLPRFTDDERDKETVILFRMFSFSRISCYRKFGFSRSVGYYSLKIIEVMILVQNKSMVRNKDGFEINS